MALLSFQAINVNFNLLNILLVFQFTYQFSEELWLLFPLNEDKVDRDAGEDHQQTITCGERNMLND